MSALLLFSEHLDEFILGADWLGEHSCCWRFDRHTIAIDGREVELHSRPSRVTARRVHISEDVTVMPESQTHVPVRVTFDSFRAPPSIWVVEPKAITNGFISARIVLADGDQLTALPVMNLSSKQVSLQCNYLIDSAEIAPLPLCYSDSADMEPKSTPSLTSGDKVHAVGHVQCIIDRLPGDFTP